MDQKYPRGHFFSKRIPFKKFQLKISTFNQSEGDVIWWPHSSKQNLTWAQLRNAHRYQKYVWLVRIFFKSFLHVQVNSVLSFQKLVNLKSQIKLFHG